MPVMTRTLVDRSGRRIEPGRLLGRGGEGAVHEVIGEPSLVAKIYYKPLSPQRADKIEAMTKMASTEVGRYCAWPSGLLLEQSRAHGLLMPRITGRKELHVLHGPKSRKTEFPDVGFDFLVHVALNIARAFAHLHSINVIIGDVNDRGIMVGDDGTVRLIDCDSFQVATPQKTFFCEVGVPEYTPPELQGQSLSAVLRTENHDVFGLAVLIFRLLFVGRHPFAGNFQGGHKEIHEAIREARYAYSSDAARTRMQPPPNMLAVTDGAGASIATLFEQAFSPEAIPSHSRMTGAVPKPRPTARDWVAALEALRTNLAICRFNTAHAYVRTLSACPWCELEQRYNVDLFHFIPAEGDAAAAIDVDAIWQALGALTAPKIPEPISETLAPTQPTSVPSALLNLREEATGLIEEARRARDVADQLRRDADQKRDEAETILDQLTATDSEVLHIVARLSRLKGTEPRYPTKTLLIAVGILGLVLALRFQSLQFMTLGGLALAALGAVDTLVSRVRRSMVGRIERHLHSLRLARIARDSELKNRYEAVGQAANAAELETHRTADLATALEKAAADAQSRYARDSKMEIDVRDMRLEAAQRSAEAARSKLAGLAAEAKALQTAIGERRRRLALSRAALTRLTQQRDAEYKRLREQDRVAQLHRFLDMHYINKADIKGITRALKSALASFGIETAADINPMAVSKVPGFGKVRTQHMRDWRNHVAKRFRYRPGLDIDPAQRKAIENKYLRGRLRIARDFTTAQTQLEKRIRELAERIPIAKQAADTAVITLAQARSDRRALNL